MNNLAIHYSHLDQNKETVRVERRTPWKKMEGMESYQSPDA